MHARPWTRDPRSWAALAAVLVFAVLFATSARPRSAGTGGTSGVVRTVVGEARFSTNAVSVTISPDGRTIVFLGGEGHEPILVRRRLDELRAEPIAGTEGAKMPFVSPDGEWLGFVRNWGIERVPLSGGSVVPVTEDVGGFVGFGAGVSWGADGIYYYDMTSSRISRIPSVGGAVTPVAGDAALLEQLVWWSHLPDGRVLVSRGGVPSRIGVLDAEAGDVRLDSTTVAFAPHFVAPDALVFGRLDGTLLAARFDPDRAAITGPAVPIATEVEVANWTPQFDVSATGHIVYVLDEPDELVIDDLNGNIEPFTSERRNFHNWASLSPDGAHVAVTTWDGPGEQLRVYDADGRGRNLTQGQHILNPIWSPDGGTLTYGWWDHGLARVAAGGGEPEVLIEEAGAWQPAAWDNSGRYLAHMSLHVYEPMLFDVESGTSAPFSPGTNGVGLADYSPDGSLIAFQSRHLERYQIWLQRVREGVPAGSRVRVSLAGGIAPRWGPDGMLYYIRWRETEWPIAHLVRVEVTRTPDLRVGREEIVADWSGDGVDSAYRFDFRPDGKVVRIRTSPRRELILLQNWRTLLEIGPGRGP